MCIVLFISQITLTHFTLTTKYRSYFPNLKTVTLNHLWVNDFVKTQLEFINERPVLRICFFFWAQFSFNFMLNASKSEVSFLHLYSYVQKEIKITSPNFLYMIFYVYKYMYLRIYPKTYLQVCPQFDSWSASLV
jgi:hypothetical protein